MCLLREGSILLKSTKQILHINHTLFNTYVTVIRKWHCYKIQRLLFISTVIKNKVNNWGLK